jgi:hypothetical protein
MAGEEEWARRIVEKELGRSVELHDDNSKPGMYDLRIGPPDAPDLALECVGAIDPIRTETWNVSQAEGLLDLALRGDWVIVHTPGARIKAIKKRLEPLLQELEDRGLRNVPVNLALNWDSPVVYEELDSLNITRAYCYRLPGTGKVSLMMPGIGGAPDSQGSAVPEWISEFLSDPAREDVLLKLQRSGAPARHAFVIVSLGGAAWPVEYYLTGALGQLPAEAPRLPQPVTGVWIVSELGQRDQKGLRWDGSAWRRFEARCEGIKGPPGQ